MFLPENRHSPMSRAFQETEQEIFTEAMGIPLDEHPNYVSDGVDTSLEAVTGWEGTALSDEEQLARAMDGDLDNNYDRPLALREEISVFQENEALRKQNRELIEYANAAVNLPHMQAAREQQRYNEHTELMQWATDFRPGGGADQIIGAFRNAQGQLQNASRARANASLAAAHRDYGPAFETAYNALATMDPSDPLSQQLFARVFNSHDPGEELMRLADHSMMDVTHDSRQPPPFMPGSRQTAEARASSLPRRGGNSLSYDDLENLDNIRGGSEAQIFDDAVGDSRDNAYWWDQFSGGRR